jgi:hypothetical protein
VGEIFPGTSRVTEYHSVKKLGFQFLGGETGSPAARHSGKYWTSEHLGEAGLLALYAE